MRLSLLSLLVISSTFVWAADEKSTTSVQTAATASHTFSKHGIACNHTIATRSRSTTTTKATTIRTPLSHTFSKHGIACNHTIATRSRSATATDTKASKTTSSKPTDTSDPDKPDPKDDPKFPVGLEEDASWAKNITAIGDSYTAAIGVGQEVDKKARRYSGSYVMRVQELLSNPTKNPQFQFIAYSGAVSKEIREKQVAILEDDSQDVVLVTAGGNDALLTELLKACIYAPTSVDHCDDAIANSQKVIDDDLRKDISKMLEDLAPKMTKNGVAVYTLYAQFFNSENKECDKRSMSLLEGFLPQPTKVFWTTDLRKKLNKLVVNANEQIRKAIEDVKDKINIEIADWDPIAKATHGRFCEPGVKDKYRDPKNAGLLFNRLDVGIPNLEHKRRDGSIDPRKYNEPQDLTFTFHPNPLGHIVIAGEVLSAIDRFRQKLAKKKREPICSQAEVTEAKCLKRELAVTQRAFDGPINLEETIKDWCKKNKGVDVGKKAGGTSTDVDKRVASRFDYWYYSFWLSAEQRNLPGCDGAKLDPDDCTNRMTKAMAKCDPGSGDSHGYEVNSRCMKYTVDIGKSLAKDSPPWASLESDVCKDSDNGATIDKQEFIDRMNDWCKDPTKALDIPSSNEYLSFKFEKNDDKCDDLKKDCENTVPHLWTRCAANSVRQEVFSPGFRAKKGPLSGSGGTNGECGHYSFEAKKKYSDAVKKVSPGTVAILMHQRPVGLASTRTWEVLHLDKEDDDYCKGNPGGIDAKGLGIDDRHPEKVSFPPSFQFKEANNRDMAIGDWPCSYEAKGDKEAGTLKCEGWEEIACKSTSDALKLYKCKVKTGTEYRVPRIFCNIDKKDQLF